jgi:hypothetical protein
MLVGSVLRHDVEIVEERPFRRKKGPAWMQGSEVGLKTVYEFGEGLNLWGFELEPS